MPLTLFFDSRCPLCAMEMDQLAELDFENNLNLEDIHAEDFRQRFPHIDPVSADKYLHAQYSDGKMIYGLDVTHQAWALVGQKRWLAILRWPVLRWFADMAYKIFARYRYGISFALTGQRRCESCVQTGQENNQSSCNPSDKY